MINSKIFLITFILSITFLILAIDGSITGNLAFNEESTYCNNEGCYANCKSDIDCQSIGGICCSKEGFNVCTKQSECQNLRKTSKSNDALLLMATLFISLIPIYYSLTHFRTKRF